MDDLIIDEMGQEVEDFSILPGQNEEEESNIIYLNSNPVSALDESSQRFSGDIINSSSGTDYTGVLYDIFYSVKNIEYYLSNMPNSTLHNEDMVLDEIAGMDHEEQLLQNLSNGVESESEVVQSEQNAESEVTLADVVESINSLSMKMDSICINQVNAANNQNKIGVYSVSLLACLFGSFAIYALLKLIKL